MFEEGSLVNWKAVLMDVSDRVAATTVSKSWILMGSAATALQGCDILPRDLDIVVRCPEDVLGFVKPFFADIPGDSHDAKEDIDHWISTASQPVTNFTDPIGFDWSFARWYMDSVKVEVACIRPPAGFASTKIYEFQCQEPNHVSVGHTRVAVVPLEIQLRTNLDREKQERVNEILRVFHSQGYNTALLSRSLTPEQFNYVNERLNKGL